MTSDEAIAERFVADERTARRWPGAGAGHFLVFPGPLRPHGYQRMPGGELAVGSTDPLDFFHIPSVT
jgi:hypothetical protein